jgi:hypothetical protein
MGTTCFWSPAEYVGVKSGIKEKIMSPTAWDFQNRLTAILNDARRSGMPYVDVDSDKLHKQAGGQPNASDRMPVCWDVMRKMMRRGDSIVKEPTGERDVTLIVRYAVQATRTISPKAN